ncbi:MAG: hypothetical protein HC809_16840 [Gammaproteobacteria bacterium]|nr:hypothetical protein [Gammaproteobacteria bacterium]
MLPVVTGQRLFQSFNSAIEHDTPIFGDHLASSNFVFGKDTMAVDR